MAGIVLGVLSILFGVTGRPSLPYAAGDVRATPEFNLIIAVTFVAVGAFAALGFTVRLTGGLRGRR